jgi:hypothetical protein
MKNNLKKLLSYLNKSNFRKEAAMLVRLAQQLVSDKPTLYFLVGYSASGKSDWINKNNLQDSAISRDDIVESKAKELMIGEGSYDDMFARIPASLTPAGIPPKEVWQDPSKELEVDEYCKKVEEVALEYNSNPENEKKILMYGKLVPYNKNLLKMIIVNFGISTDRIVPFSYENINNANKEVEMEFSTRLSNMAKSRQDIVIDMMSLNKPSRDAQRKKIVAVIEGVPDSEAKASDISKYYNQVAIVFAPESGYSQDLIKKLKEVNELRRQDYLSMGRKKTIPDSVYETKYEPPTTEENFSKIDFVGIPSLEKLKSKEASFKNKINKIAQEDEELLDIIGPAKGKGFEPFHPEDEDYYTRNKILPDKNTRTYDKNVGSDNYHDEWYKTVQGLGDKIILIPFDSSDLEEDDISRLNEVFSLASTYSSYEDLKQTVSIASSTNDEFKRGDLESLQRLFPSLWSEINSTLLSKGLEDDEVVYMFYNQENVNKGRLAQFSKDAFYFGHDLGHATFDFSEDSDFKNILYKFIEDMIKLYKNDKGAILWDSFQKKHGNYEDGNLDESELSDNFIQEFFDNLYSDPQDGIADVFQRFTSNNISISAPETIYFQGDWDDYELFDKSGANIIIDKYIKTVKNYIKDEKTGKGPLDYYRGSVVLFDL